MNFFRLLKACWLFFFFISVNHSIGILWFDFSKAIWPQSELPNSFGPKISLFVSLENARWPYNILWHCTSRPVVRENNSPACRTWTVFIDASSSDPRYPRDAKLRIQTACMWTPRDRGKLGLSFLISLPWLWYCDFLLDTARAFEDRYVPSPHSSFSLQNVAPRLWWKTGVSCSFSIRCLVFSKRNL